MSENALATTVDTSIIERVVMQGDLAQLKPEERLEYYRQVCASMGLNPLTRPFDYIDLHGKLVLYAKRDAADQLRKIHGISIDKPDVTITDDLVMVSVTGYDKTGRRDSELGVVYLGRKTGDDKANCILKAITKAKRRLTLSIVGLGWLDETEVDTIPDAQHVYPPEQRAIIDEAADLDAARRDWEGIEPEPPQEPPTARRSWPDATIQAIMDANLARPAKHVITMLNLSKVLRTTDDLALALEWANHYRGQREDGVEPDAAAQYADKQLEGIEEGSNG